MKKLLFVLAVLALNACKQDPIIPCDTYAEYVDKTPLTDPEVFHKDQSIKDTLLKYPELRVYKVTDDSLLYGFKSFVYHEGLRVCFENYYLYRNRLGELIEVGRPVPDVLPASLTPEITPGKAVELAKEALDFSSYCPTYELAIHEGFLVWVVSSARPTVFIDAHTGEVRYTDTGIRSSVPA